MLATLFTSLIKDILTFLNENRNFFELENSTKDQKLETYSVKFPKVIQEFLKSCNESDFFSELKVLTKYIKGNRDKKTQGSSKIMEALSQFLSQDFAKLLDDGKTNEAKGIFDKALAEIISTYSSQEICETTDSFLRDIKDTPYIIVQSPRKISVETKKDIRGNIKEKYEYGFPIFQVNPKLIGGMRLFIDGKTSDQSWIGQINRLNSIKLTNC